MLFKFSFISCYGLARVWEGWAERERERKRERQRERERREREPVISFAIGLQAHDVTDVGARKLCDWPVKNSPHFLLPTAKSSGTNFIMQYAP